MTVPDPMATDGVVFNDMASRTLVVRLPDAANGFTRLLWRHAHQALLKAEQVGFRSDVPAVWGHTDTQRDVAHGQPGELITLRFTFHPDRGNAYLDLASKPSLTATVVLDRSTNRFKSVRFHHRRAV